MKAVSFHLYGRFIAYADDMCFFFTQSGFNIIGSNFIQFFNDKLGFIKHGLKIDRKKSSWVVTYSEPIKNLKLLGLKWIWNDKALESDTPRRGGDPLTMQKVSLLRDKWDFTSLTF